MPTIKNISIFLMILFIYSDFTFQGNKEGIFKTFEDYTEGKITYVGEFKNLSHAGSDYTLSFEKGNEKIKYKLDEKPFWGFRDNKGDEFRAMPVLKSEKNMYPYKIISLGKISYYGSYDARITNKNGHVMVNTLGKPSYLANGVNGQVYYFSFKDLKKALADDPELLEKFNKKNSDYVDIIIEYNNKHK